MGHYAKNTSVSIDRSRAEIERILNRYDAQEFIYGRNGTESVVGFVIDRKAVRFHLLLPPRDDEVFMYTAGRHRLRSPEAALVEWEQACRQHWRALALVIKAKLEAVKCGITTFEEEFLAHLVMPGGKTIGQHVLPLYRQAIETGEAPSRLLTFTGSLEE